MICGLVNRDERPMNRQLRQEDPDFAPCSWHVIRGVVVIVCVHGDLDGLAAPALAACLDQQTGRTVGSDGVEVVLMHVTFLDARGITTLLVAAHTARQRAVGFGTPGARRGCFACSTWLESERSSPRSARPSQPTPGPISGCDD